MSTEREEYIRRLVEKAERERAQQGRSGNRDAETSPAPRGAKATARRTEPSVRPASRRVAPPVDPANGDTAVYPNGKNGRQVVESRDGNRGDGRRVGSRQGHNGRGAVRPRDPRALQPKNSGVVDESQTAQGANGAPRNIPPRVKAQKNVRPQVEESQSEAHIWFSLSMIFVSLYLAVSTVSYLVYWSVDEHLTYVEYLLDLRAVGAENWGGKLGAIVGNLLVGRSFGVMGLGFSVLAMIGAIKALRIASLPMRKGLRSVFLLMITGSVALGHFAGYDPEVFGSGYGGEMGIYVASWLENVIGTEGVSLLIVIAVIAILYFVNSTSVRSLVRWVSHRIEHSKLQRAARMMREREQDALLARQLIEREAALAAGRAAAAAAAKAEAEIKVQEDVSDVSAENSNVDTIQSAVVDQDHSSVESIQNEASQDKENQQQTEDVQIQISNETDEPQNVPSYDPSTLLRLEGDQWGYIYDWDVSGTPIYIYVDRGALDTMSYSIAATAPVAVAGSAFGADTKREPIEEHEIEFVVKSYNAADSESSDDTSSVDDVVVSTAEVTAQSDENITTVLVEEPRKAIFMPSPDDPNFIVERSEGDPELDDTTINLTELYDPTLELSSYKKPPVDLMTDHSQKVHVTGEELLDNKNRIVNTLETFGIKIATIEATIGPTVTLYEIIPAPGIRISKIKNLEDDIALSLSALGIRIIAPIPGRGTIGIEVPNKDKETVSMYSVIKSAKFQESKFELPVALGKTIQNETFVVDLAKMPHLLVAGATGQGKSVGLNAILTSLLYKKHPSQLKFILVDPKKVELTLYAKLEKHFLAKMPGEDDAIITDTQKVIYTLNSLCVEMDARYDLLKAAKVRNILEYNEKFTHRRLNPEKGHRFLPYFVVIIDEFADLIMTAGREVETPIARIAQLARAVGIHLIIATQRPTTNIITGVIKANFPARIAFRVTSMIDSRTILDSPGANQLVGRGDMLVSTGSEVTRVQCAFIDTPEVDAITEFISAQRGYVSAYELPEYVPESKDGGGVSREVDSSKRDPLFEEVARYVVANQNGSASTIQRKFSIGFNRAGRLVDQLEAAGIVGGADGSKARQVLVQDPMTLEMLLDT